MSDTGETIDGFEGPPGESRSIPLETTGDVEREMAKVYRAMRKKRISVQDGNGLTQTLSSLGKLMRERHEDEAMRRLEELERKRGASQVSPSTN